MSERNYQDADGKTCSLDSLCRKEPAWAANRIRVMADQLQQTRHAIASAQRELADYRLRIARALGMTHTPDMGAEWPCSDDDAVNAITELQRQVQERAACWHCGDVLIQEAVPRCEDCPPHSLGCDLATCKHCEHEVTA